jgi:hypothetical protein
VPNYRIASDTPVDVKPNEVGSERRMTRTQKGVFSHKELLTEFRKKETPRMIHSDGFLALSGLDIEPAYVCECGFSGLFKRDSCIRCGKAL